MLLATWNVNSLTARLPRLLEFLDLHRPDLLCMQETKVRPEAFPHGELEAAGYHAVDHSGGRWAGVAIAAPASRAFDRVARGLPGEPDPAEARWIEATVGGLRMTSVYVPNGREPGTPAFQLKLAFLDAMAAHVSATVERPDVIMGDMNVAPADTDVYDPAAFVGATHITAQERSRLQTVLAAGELVDAHRVVNGNQPGFTWWDYRQGHFHRGLGMRIDLALVSSRIAGGLRSCGIDRNFRKGPKPSDHAPLMVEVALPMDG